MSPTVNRPNGDWKYVLDVLEEYGKELAVASAFLKKLDKSLFGNGQPGILTMHNDRLDRLEKEMARRHGAEYQRKTDLQSVIKLVATVGTLLGIWAHILGLGKHI